MISSLVILVVLCGVAVSQESKLVKVVTVKEKVEPRIEYHEEPGSGYPLIVQQPYPIIVEKRLPYDEERYDRKGIPRAHTSTGEEFEYRPEVVRSPIIFTVSTQPAPRTHPYPLRIQKESWPLPCTGEDPDCLHEEFDYRPKHPVKKKNIYKSREGLKEENIKVSDYEKKEGSVQHREIFQTPILIAIEKPGYRYVKHLVGEGVLPKARQFHVLILEEDDPIDNAKHEKLNSAEDKQKAMPENQSLKDLLNYNKHEENLEGNKENKEIRLKGSIAGDSEIIFPSTKEEQNEDETKKTGQNERDEQVIALQKQR